MVAGTWLGPLIYNESPRSTLHNLILLEASLTRTGHDLKYVFVSLAVLAIAAISCSALGLPFGSGEQGAAPAPTQTRQPAGQEPTEAGPQQESDAAGLPVAEGACANSLMPLAVGNQWVYVQYAGEGTEAVEEGQPTPVPEATMTWTVVDVQQDRATIDMQAEELGITTQYTLRCEDGAILSFPTFSMEIADIGQTSGEADLSYEHTAGVFLPSVATLEANNWDHQWSTEIAIMGSIVARPFDDGTSFEMTWDESPWIMDWTTAGTGDQAFESVQVAAGTYERALRLEQHATVGFDMQLEGMGALAANFTSEALQWHVEGVGMVKNQAVTSSIALDDTELPMTDDLDLTSTLELKEFRQGVEVGE